MRAYVDDRADDMAKQTVRTDQPMVRNKSTRNFERNKQKTKKQKLKYFGHVSRHDSLEKLILQERVEGSMSRCRLRRKWTDDIQDWLSEYIGDVAKMAEDRQLFRSRVGTATSRLG